MIQTTSPALGHSAQVRMHLAVNGHVFSINQLAPNFAILDNSHDHSPTDAEIVLSVDGQESRWPVHLPSGISVSTPRTPLTRLPE